MTLCAVCPTRSFARNVGMTPPHCNKIHTLDAAQEFPGVPDRDVRNVSIFRLNQLLADTVTLRDMYTLLRPANADPVLPERHRLFDRHFAGQHVLVDEIAEDIQTLGGDIIATAHDITTRTLIPRKPTGLTDGSDRLARLLQAHHIVLVVSWATIHELSRLGVEDPSVSNVIRTNEIHVSSLINVIMLERQVNISSKPWGALVQSSAA